MATHDIIVVTYGPDAEWTKYMLRSVRKFARGFRHLLLVYPQRDHETFKELAAPFPQVVLRPVENEVGNGHRHQMLLKCRADTFSDADFFHHIDADCVVNSRWVPEDSFTDGKPDLLYTLFSECGSPWQGITENTLGFPCPAETMRRFPFVYPRFLYGELRAHIERHHRVSFDHWVYNAPGVGGVWHGFSEFPALGAFAMARFADRFHLYNTNVGMKPNHILQQWSHYARKQCPEHEVEWERAQIQMQRLTDGWENAS